MGPSHIHVFSVILAVAPGSRTGQSHRAQEGSLGVDCLSLLAAVAARGIAANLSLALLVRAARMTERWHSEHVVIGFPWSLYGKKEREGVKGVR